MAKKMIDSAVEEKLSAMKMPVSKTRGGARKDLAPRQKEMLRQRRNAANKKEDVVRQAETKIEASRKAAGTNTTTGGHKCQTLEA
jgi:hypothetical protein